MTFLLYTKHVPNSITKLLILLHPSINLHKKPDFQKVGLDSFIIYIGSIIKVGVRKNLQKNLQKSRAYLKKILKNESDQTNIKGDIKYAQ